MITNLKKLLRKIYIISDKISAFLFLIIMVIFSLYALIGFIKLIIIESSINSVEFIKYLSITSFTLAGFTFLGSIFTKRKGEKIERIGLDIIYISYLFIVAGFFGLIFIGLYYLPLSITVKYAVFHSNFKIISSIFSIISSLLVFLYALIYLILLLRTKIFFMYEKKPKK